METEGLKKEWLQDTLELGAIESYVESNTPKSNKAWIADQVNSR